MEIVFKTAVGVFIGGLAAALAFTEIQTVRIEIAAKKALSQIASEVEQASDRQAKAQQAEALRQAKIKADEWQRMQAAQNMAAQMEAQELVSKRAEEAAWDRYYQPNAACKANWTGNCADDFIVAKRKFKEHYRPSR